MIKEKGEVHLVLIFKKQQLTTEYQNELRSPAEAGKHACTPVHPPPPPLPPRTWNNPVTVTLELKSSPHYKGAHVYKLVCLFTLCFIWHQSPNKNQSPIPFNV